MATNSVADESSWLDRDPIAYHAEARPTRLAAVDLASGRRLTYADLDAYVARATGWLCATLGAPKGERVAYLGRNGLEEMAVLFACHRATTDEDDHYEYAVAL